jgi:DTW domain-containing protein YfiP
MSHFGLSPSQPRAVCYKCWRAGGTCYCAQIKKFSTDFSLVLLVHPQEARNRVGTVRIAHLSVQDSEMIIGKGQDFDSDPRVARYLNDPDYLPAVLFPGPRALRIDQVNRGAWIPRGKRLALFVIDATWRHASQMVRSSRVLSSLPQLSFEPSKTSEYRFRKQPEAYCLSTVEAVHTVIERLAPRDRAHDGMIDVFRGMVKFQVECEQRSNSA